VRWVLDASVAVRWCLEPEADQRASDVLERLVADPLSFAVPELFGFEVLAVLCRAHQRPLEMFREGIVPLLNGGMFRQPMTERLAMGAGEFTAAGLTGYDACYASLARELHATWLTFDGQAHRRIASTGVSCCLADGLPPGW
jgi:predicted nucleic acid-binding protein